MEELKKKIKKQSWEEHKNLWLVNYESVIKILDKHEDKKQQTIDKAIEYINKFNDICECDSEQCFYNIQVDNFKKNILSILKEEGSNK